MTCCWCVACISLKWSDIEIRDLFECIVYRMIIVFMQCTVYCVLYMPVACYSVSDRFTQYSHFTHWCCSNTGLSQSKWSWWSKKWVFLQHQVTVQYKFVHTHILPYDFLLQKLCADIVDIKKLFYNYTSLNSAYYFTICLLRCICREDSCLSLSLLSCSVVAL